MRREVRKEKTKGRAKDRATSNNGGIRKVERTP